jgi:hypothetical protein
MPLCPSAQPDMDGAILIGVVVGAADQPLVSYLDEPTPVTEKLLSLTAPVEPTEVFRFAAPCAESGCQHFDGSTCRLAGKVSQTVPTSITRLPACSIRPSCRWWREQGKAACMRCPFIVTKAYAPSDELRVASDPATPSSGL